ncbi:uncharacterized protein [Solanum tuberosum]|uniref:uncharacterized protein isoform X3 n=1 Tax=Solanum tuberosum TaxID=4113 RepID=UPI00073A14F3|nr:PREDICTED: uncharacterized protein LOC102578875 isoform X3 [Solanum tuberosum]
MESEGDEDTHQPPKWSRPTKQAQFSSTSKKDSFLTIPVLPEELITEILLRLPVEPLLKFRWSNHKEDQGHGNNGSRMCLILAGVVFDLGCTFTCLLR